MSIFAKMKSSAFILVQILPRGALPRPRPAQRQAIHPVATPPSGASMTPEAAPPIRFLPVSP